MLVITEQLPVWIFPAKAVAPCDIPGRNMWRYGLRMFDAVGFAMETLVYQSWWHVLSLWSMMTYGILNRQNYAQP